MFHHEKKLFHPVAVERPNPQYAVLLQEQLGGGNGELCADILSNIASEQRAKVVYEYLYRQIEDKKVRETIDFLLNREEAHNQMFRDAFNEVQDSGSNRDFGTTKAAKMYFSLSNPGPNTFAGNEVSAPKFD